jgi:hypothetical protein
MDGSKKLKSRFAKLKCVATMSSLPNFALARPTASSRVIAKFTIETLTMIIIFNYVDNNYYIVNSSEPTVYTRIPDDFTIGNTITWFYNTQCAPMWNRELICKNPSFVLHKQCGDKLYPLRPLSVPKSLQLMKANWRELSPNPIVGTLNF